VKQPFDGAPEVQMLFSTLLLAINNGIHGLLDPDFINRITSKQKPYFLGQPGYGQERQKGVTSFTDLVKSTNIGMIVIPQDVKDRLIHCIHNIKGTTVVSRKRRKRTIEFELEEIPASPKTKKSPLSPNKVRTIKSKEQPWRFRYHQSLWKR
jgi:hypothetical protein